jgi:hypothetical protein
MRRAFDRHEAFAIAHGRWRDAAPRARANPRRKDAFAKQ